DRNAHKESHMLRRSLSAAVVLFVLGGFVFAETYRGIITKFDKDEIKIKVGKKGEEPTEKTFKVSKDVKITKKKSKDDEGTEVSVSDFTKAVEKAADGKLKGVGASIETEGEGSKETVTKISIIARKGKKGGGSN